MRLRAVGIFAIRVHPWLALSAALSRARTKYKGRSSFIVLRYAAQELPLACLLWGPAHTLGEISLLNPCHRAQPSPQGLLYFAPPSKVLPWMEAPEKSKELG